MSLPFIKLPFSPVNHSLSSSFRCKHRKVLGNCTSALSFSCWNYGRLRSRNANPPACCFSTTTHGMRSADSSGKSTLMSSPAASNAQGQHTERGAAESASLRKSQEGAVSAQLPAAAGPAPARGCCLWKQGWPSHLCQRLCFSHPGLQSQRPGSSPNPRQTILHLFAL